MATTVALSYRSGLTLVDEDGKLAVRHGRIGFTIAAPRPGLRAALGALHSPVTDDDLRTSVLEQDGMAGLHLFQQVLAKLDALGLLARTVIADGAPVLTVAPMSDRHRCAAEAAANESRWLLSRFAIVHRRGDQLIVESPLGYAVATLHDARGAALVAALAETRTPHALAQLAGMPDDAAAWCMALLDSAQIVSAVADDGRAAEDAHSALTQWEPHDLFFHSRSRVGRHDGGFGGTYRFADTGVPPLPVLHPGFGGTRIALAAPDLATLRASDPPLQDVVEARTSIRDYGEAPITVAQLGEFLFRCARIKAHLQNEMGELAPRPYPAGGAMYELEVYPVIDRCEGVTSGLYWYDGLAHALESVAPRTPAVETLLEMAWITADRKSRPQVLLCITARFQRMQWKYESMAYAAMLKHVGVVYHAMYLAATAMHMAPCALGGGDSDLFAAATGLDYFAETTVGEFLLGSRAD